MPPIELCNELTEGIMGIKPTFYDFSLTDGTVVQVTRNYGALYMLRNPGTDF